MKLKDLTTLRVVWSRSSDTTRAQFHPNIITNISKRPIQISSVLAYLSLAVSLNPALNWFLSVRLPYVAWVAFVSTTNGLPVGFAYVRSVSFHEGQLGVFVDDAHQGRGIGKNLLQTLLSEARKRHFTRISLGVIESNRRASRLYESLGFKITSKLHWETWEGKLYAEYQMHLNLQNQ